MAQFFPPAHGSDRELDRDARADADRLAAAGNASDFAANPMASGSLAAPGETGARAPFVCQHGNRVLLLEHRSPGWVLAELRFDPSACRYVEVRRARYRWAREASGALLSRALTEGTAVADRTDRDLRDWLISE